MAKRAAHFKYRIPDQPAGFRLTPDDEQMLLEVYRHDIIDSATLYSLFPNRSRRNLSNRLLKLHQNDYLFRLKQLEQIFIEGGGSHPIAYTLAQSGANLLWERFGLLPKKQHRRYRERNQRLGAQTIFHTLEQSRFLVAMRLSAGEHPGVEFLYPDEVYRRFAPNILERSKLPSMVRAKVNWHGYSGTEATRPDGFFMLYYPDAPENRRRRCIFLEIDRGTETIEPSLRKAKTLAFWKDTSFLRKLVVYAYAFKTKTHEKDFGIPTFQVLTVTTKETHITKMQDAYRRHLAVQPHSVREFRYLFTDFRSVTNAGRKLVSLPVVDGKGNTRTLASP